jgi:O-antigen ligase
MAATSTYLRHDGGIAAHSWIAVALAMLGLALGCGYALALGEVAGLYVGLSLVCAVAVLFDFRVGAVLLLLMLPTSASELFPHGLMGITGLNPLNLLLFATVGSYIIHGRLQRTGTAVVPMQVIWLYIAPIVMGGLIGMGHIQEIPSFFYESGSVQFFTERQYLVLQVARPLLIVAIALMVGAAAARSLKPERFIVVLAASAGLIALIQIGFVILQGASLAEMAAAESRRFYAPLGMHANMLGRLHLFAFALLLFVWPETKHPRTRSFLALVLGLLAIALVLTFSRACIGTAALVGALFLMWKFNARTLSLGLLLLTLLAMIAGDAILSRATMGFGEGANAVSAGRIDGIWLPLLPEVAESPLWGQGLSSILWSFAMTNESMLRVGHPHNAYLEALLDTGLIGLVLFLVYYAHVWKRFRAASTNPALSPELRGLFQGGLAALAAFLVTGLVGSSLRPEAEAAFLWIAIGLMYGLRGRRAG